MMFAVRLATGLAAVFLAVAIPATLLHWRYAQLAGVRNLAEAVTILTLPCVTAYWSICHEDKLARDPG